MGSGASLVIKSKGREVEITHEGRHENLTLEPGHDVLDVLKHEMGSLRYEPDPACRGSAAARWGS